MRVALLVSGASGMALPVRVLRVLARRGDIERVHLVVSAGAVQVLRHERGENAAGAAASAAAGARDLMAAAELSADESAKIVVHRDSELDAPISSGSYRLRGTIVLPCSAGTLGALATGSARTLIHRAGAVALKERWPLVLGFRETPLSLVHLENLRRMAYCGAEILPPIPAFYIGEANFERFLDHYALRVLDRLGLEAPGDAGLRWPVGS